MITGTSVALLMGASPPLRLYSAKIRHHANHDGGGRQHRRYTGHQRVCVIFVGILGAVFGHTLLNAMRIHTKAARGLAMGTASRPGEPHVALSWIIRKGAFSSLALVICGIADLSDRAFLFPIILAVDGLKFTCVAPISFVHKLHK